MYRCIFPIFFISALITGCGHPTVLVNGDLVLEYDPQLHSRVNCMTSVSINLKHMLLRRMVTCIMHFTGMTGRGRSNLGDWIRIGSTVFLTT
jgi:hypothetical protein